MCAFGDMLMFLVKGFMKLNISGNEKSFGIQVI